MEDPSQQCFKVNIRVWNLDLTGSICGLLNLHGPLKKTTKQRQCLLLFGCIVFLCHNSKTVQGMAMSVGQSTTCVPTEISQ